MRQTIFIYGLVMAVGVALLKMLEYQYVFSLVSAEIYIGIISVLFTILGIWVGQRVTRKKKIYLAVQPGNFVLNEEVLAQTGISKREYEVLELMARGLSNQEIANSLYVSLNTVKTHTANLYLKLEARRRTQAIQKAKQLHLLP
ncbi:LuxR C-terminal-related transcriptional regulator [Oscillatoria amoena NRMC-F 0135]|nr:LuxR C-terminal-related transcriptional regulator [Oscillatoria amoena NRMC-F 0135]